MCGSQQACGGQWQWLQACAELQGSVSPAVPGAGGHLGSSRSVRTKRLRTPAAYFSWQLLLIVMQPSSVLALACSHYSGSRWCAGVSTHLWQVEALHPGPPRDLVCVKVDRVIVDAGNWSILQQLAPPHLSINNLQCRLTVSESWLKSS